MSNELDIEIDPNMKETPLVSKEIATLEKMNELSQITPASVTAVKIESPTEAVEQKLSDFVRDAFAATNKDLEFNERLKEELLSRLDSMSENQLLALFSSTNLNLNDKISKLIAPTFQLMTAKQNAEIAERNRQEAAQQAAVNVNIGSSQGMRSVNEIAPQEALQGLNTIFNLINAQQKLEASKKVSAEDTE